MLRPSLHSVEEIIMLDIGQKKVIMMYIYLHYNIMEVFS